MLKNKNNKRTLISRIRTYFLTGVVVLIPIGITIYLTLLIMSVSPSLIPDSINPNKYLPFNIPGLEFLIAFIIITFVGMRLFIYICLKWLSIVLAKLFLTSSIETSVKSFICVNSKDEMPHGLIC